MSHDDMRLFAQWLKDEAPRKYHRGIRFSEYRARAEYWRECSGYWLALKETLDADPPTDAS